MAEAELDWKNLKPKPAEISQANLSNLTPATKRKTKK